MIRYEYIFCDLDGPILDGKMRHYRCYSDILEKYEKIPMACDDYWNAKRKGTKLKGILEKSDFYDTELFMKEWIARIEEIHYLKYDVLKPNLVTALSYLKKRANKLCLLTLRKNYDNLIWELQDKKIISCFDQILHHEISGKNAKCEILDKIYYDKALLIGDTELDIYTAETMNCDFIGIINGLRTVDIFENYVCFEEMIDICKMHYL